MNKHIITLVGIIGITLTIGNTAHAQALTQEQLTQQIKVLTDQANSSNLQLKQLQQDSKKMGRLLNNPAMLELLQRVDELSDELSQLRGEIEQQEHNLDGIKARQRELYLDIDRRLRNLENRATTPAPKPEQTPDTSSQTLPDLPLPDVPKVDAGALDPAVAITPATGALIESETSSAVGATASDITSSEERDAYQEAFDTLKEGRYKQAKTELKTFLTQFPQSSYAGNAQYWLGEANYVTRNFEQGITEFNIVLNRYPGSTKVPDAMLKLGYTYYELKQFDQARQILQSLVERHPKSTAARLANKRLSRIRKEGH